MSRIAIFKSTRLIAAAVLATFALSANATLIGPTQINQGSNSSPNAEIGAIESQTGLTDLIFGGKIENTFPGSDGPFSAGADAGGFTEVMWDLTGTGDGLYAIAVKSGSDFLNVWELTDDMRISGTGSVWAPNNINSISHISFFVKAFTPPPVGTPEPSTVLLLGLGFLALRRARSVR